jgi:hypothetical protein
LTGSSWSVKRADPQTSSRLDPDAVSETGLFGSEREMSDRRRPEIRATPGSETSAGTVMRAEVS